jgi:hypothetical protein
MDKMRTILTATENSEHIHPSLLSPTRRDKPTTNKIADHFQASGFKLIFLDQTHTYIKDEVPQTNPPDRKPNNNFFMHIVRVGQPDEEMWSRLLFNQCSGSGFHSDSLLLGFPDPDPLILFFLQIYKDPSDYSTVVIFSN